MNESIALNISKANLRLFEHLQTFAHIHKPSVLSDITQISCDDIERKIS